MNELKSELAELMFKLQTCDWTCVEECALAGLTMSERVQCFELCHCYDGLTIPKPMVP